MSSSAATFDPPAPAVAAGAVDLDEAPAVRLGPAQARSGLRLQAARHERRGARGSWFLVPGS
jgi:hypothetical protein